MTAEECLKRTGDAVNERLSELMDELCEPGTLKNAMNYSLMAGGKRLRPALCLESAGLFGEKRLALDFACAMEMIHTYSLIHDDLPAMDNDVLRRGRPTNHVVFGEAIAILAGDGLLSAAFEVMARFAVNHPDISCAAAMDYIAKAAGVSGMVLGQAADVEFEGQHKDEDVLRYIHERKTAAMIRGSVLSGASLMGAKKEDLDALDRYGRCVGLVFQIVDDILDETGDAEKLGKTPGKDAASGKQTFAKIYGIERSRQIARQQTDEAVEALSRFGPRAETLRGIAEYLLSRDR